MSGKSEPAEGDRDEIEEALHEQKPKERKKEPSSQKIIEEAYMSGHSEAAEGDRDEIEEALKEQELEQKSQKKAA